MTVWEPICITRDSRVQRGEWMHCTEVSHSRWHETSTQITNGVFQIHQMQAFRVGKSPSFLVAFLWGTAPFCLHLSEFRVDRDQWWRSQQKWLRPWIDLFSLYLYHIGRFNVALTHLITLLLYSGHQVMHCTVLLCMQYNLNCICFRADLLKRLM